MKVREIMTQPVKTCSPETNLAAAAMEMWDGDCGVIPVVTPERRVLGMITDRDICMAVATKHRKAEEITVAEVLWESGDRQSLQTCDEEDDVRSALKTLRRHQIRRLPVIGQDGQLTGILSINDILLAERDLMEPKSKKGAGLMPQDVIDTFKSICAHGRLPAIAA
ncbi:MAG: CBS domain-containing protein [Deltaproteobacteria bacterium]|nr:CBS domain-containing protein [Deltaproteobacteria bacterium]